MNNCSQTRNENWNILLFCLICYDNLNDALLAYEDSLTHLFTLNGQVKNVCKNILKILTVLIRWLQIKNIHIKSTVLYFWFSFVGKKLLYFNKTVWNWKQIKSSIVHHLSLDRIVAAQRKILNIFRCTEHFNILSERFFC